MTTTSHPKPSDLQGAEPEWTLGDRLRKALNHADISVGAMAEMLDVSTATMARWLNDKGPVKRVYLQVWADLTGVSTHWLETGVYAMRDLNPQPADLEPARPVLRILGGRVPNRPSTVKPRLTLICGAA
jgi:transcriptional regulator with XRE-family HTH domain